MKKFLSLLLAVVMTLSLVTISAGATEYKDLTDKDELGPQYQEAVAVLNKIGVITGYDDGSFRPDVKLTRGAAAKIIVSLLIGPEAASNLPNNYAPYPDVPSNHTFAGVISFCKTKGIISGYGDGTFKPANDLTGYAFAKMLLGALGYDSATERFTGTGWTQNVLSIGQYASLFDRLDFKGSEAVSRKDAALLALNTLKATVVEYNNPLNINVTGDNTSVVVSGGQTRSYKVSNQDYATNILPQRRNINNNSRDDYNTVEFAEEHFVDLRLTYDKYNPIDDDFGRPSAEWTYKKLSIGTFPLESDFEYTTQVIHNVDTVTDGAKTRALGLSGYSVTKTNANNVVTDRANLWINGVLQDGTNGTAPELTSVADIANYTDNGTLVQVYVDNNGADFITDVVVVRTQLMEVRKVGSDYVSLDIYDDNSDADGDILYGYNYIPIDVKVNNVEAEDDYYDFLNGLKAGDLVAVVPVAVDHAYNDYDVAEAYTPETATGALTAVETYGSVNTDRNAITITVGGTKYNIALWNKDMREIDSDAVKVTKKDVTLHLDKYGNALLAEDVGSTSDWMIIGNYRQGIQNGILVTYANGWDISGNEVSLNIGARAGVNITGNPNVSEVWNGANLPPVGSLVYYTNDTSSNTGEWELGLNGVYTVSDTDSAGAAYEIRTSSSRLSLKAKANGNAVEPGYELPFYKNGVKFIYITLDESGEVDSIEIKKNPQSVTNREILGNEKFDRTIRQAQACISLNKDGSLKSADNAGVEAVVIKSESSAVSINNLLYISNYKGEAIKDENGNMVQGYVVAMLGEGGKLVATDKVIYSDRTGLRIGTFARYTPSSHDGYEDFYTLRPFAANNAASTAKNSVAVLNAKIAGTGKDKAFVGANSQMVYLDGTSYSNTATTLTRASGIYQIEQFHSDADHNLINEYPSGVENLVNLRRAQWLDLTETGIDIESASELKDAYSTMVNKNHSNKEYHRDITVTMLFNDNPESDDFRLVYMIVVNSISNNDVPDTGSSSSNQPSTGDVRSTVATNYGTVTGTSTQYAGGKRVDTVTVEAPSWAYFDSNGEGAGGNLALSKITYVKKNSRNEPYAAVKTWNVDGTGGSLGADDVRGAYANGKFTVTLNEPLANTGDYIEVSSVTWTHAKVQYILNTKDVTNSMTSAKYLEIGQSGTLSSVVYSVADAVAGDYTVTGVEDAANKGGHFASIKTAQNITGLKALGGEPVVINMTANGAKNQYTVTTEAAISGGVSITGEDAKVSITPTPTTVAEGDSVSFDIVLDDPITAVNVESYNVDITLEAADGTKIALPTAEGVTDTHHEYKTWTATTSVTIKGANIKVTPVKAAIRPEQDTITAVGSNNVTIDFIGDCSGVNKDDVFMYRAADPDTAVEATGVEKVDTDGDNIKDQLKITFPLPALADNDVICIRTSSISAITVHALDGLRASFVQYSVDETGTFFTFQIHKSVDGSSTTATFEGSLTSAAAKELIPDETPAVESVVYTLDVSGVTETGCAGAKIDDVDVTWDASGIDATMNAFVTTYNGTDGKAFTASYTSGTLTMTLKNGETDPGSITCTVKGTTPAVADVWTATAQLKGSFKAGDSFKKKDDNTAWTVIADNGTVEDHKITVTAANQLGIDDLAVTYSGSATAVDGYTASTAGKVVTFTAEDPGEKSSGRPTDAALGGITVTLTDYVPDSSDGGDKGVEYGTIQNTTPGTNAVAGADLTFTTASAAE